MSYAGKTVLITGGAGYLAASLGPLLAAEAKCVRRLHRANHRPAPLTGAAAVEDLTGDITDLALWPRLLAGVNVVFHLAAQTSIYAAARDPLADAEINVTPLLRLLETCRAHGLRPQIVLASTVTLSGVNPPLPVDEQSPDDPTTIYDLHKLAAENYLKHYMRENVVTGTVLRLANVFGPGPASSRLDRGILNQMTRKALQGEPLTIYGPGENVRDYLFVEDAAKAFFLAGQGGGELNGRHFVIGSGTGHTLLQAARSVAEQVSRHTGAAVAVNHADWPGNAAPIEKRDFVANSSAFQKATGWRAQISFAEGLARTIAALQKEVAA